MMRAFFLTEAQSWLKARLVDTGVNPDQLCFEGVSTDTRAVQPGQLFVALRGENFDGHRFIGQALAAGAVAAVVDQADPDVALPQLVVADTVLALGALAAANRRESGVGLIAITGSSGKTTVRQMTSAILTEMGPTLSTEGNLNNHIGVPHTLFRLAPEHQYAAVELGASGPGEIAHTVAMARPRVAILTNAGQAHLEGFGSYQNIIDAKGEIIDGLADDGVVVLNRDDPAFDQWRRRAGNRQVLSVSREGRPDADYRASVRVGDDQSLELAIEGPGGWHCDLVLPLPGIHNAVNALLALAACRALGATDEQVVRGLSGVQPVKGRLQALKLTDDLMVIDDSYNANPASMKAALDVLAGYSGTRIAVFGAMAELGEGALALHSDVGAHARALGIERLLAVGAGSEGYVQGFGTNAEQVQSHEQAMEAILGGRQGSTTVLVKGSRSSAMECVVEGIQKKVTNTCCSG